jgi:hypothetical protein
MKKITLLSLVLLSALLLSGCGAGKKESVNVGDVANTYMAAQDLNQDMNDPNKISSDESIENLYTIMNYMGTESKEVVKSAIKKGVEDGKKQADLDKDLVLKQEIGSGYMLGYVFGCKAVTGNEDKCNEDMGAKYQVILMGGLSEQFGGTMPAVQQN